MKLQRDPLFVLIRVDSIRWIIPAIILYAIRQTLAYVSVYVWISIRETLKNPLMVNGNQ